MSVLSGQTIAVDFTTRAVGAGETDATGTPVGTLVLDGVDAGATVTVTNKATGRYTASVLLPALVVGERVQIRIRATVSGVTDSDIVFEDVCEPQQLALPMEDYGQADGLPILGVNTAGLTLHPATGVAFSAISNNDDGFLAQGGGSGFAAVGGTGHGITALGGGSGAGINALGGASGDGMRLARGGAGLDDFFLANSDAPTLHTAVWGHATNQVLTSGGLAAVTAWTVNITGSITSVTTVNGLAAGVITEASIATPAEVSGRPTGILGMMRRLFEGRHNKRTRNRTSGVVTIRNALDSGNLETATQSTAANTDTQTAGA